MKILIYCIEIFFGLIIGWFGISAIVTTLGSVRTLNIEIVNIFFVFVFSPILIFIFILRAFFLQHTIVAIKYWLFILVVIASLLLMNAWGLHSFEFWSSISCTASVITAIIGFIQIKNLRKNEVPIS